MTVGENGLRSLYTGLTAALLRQMTYSLVRLGSYDEIKRRLTSEGTASTGQLLLAAGIAGGLGGIAGNPAGKMWHIFLNYSCLNGISPPKIFY